MLEKSLGLASEKGCFPSPSRQERDRLSWRIYGDSLMYLLKYSDNWFNTNTLGHIKKRGIKHINRLDGTLELIKNYNEKNNSVPWGELFYDDNKFPERTDIHSKFFELTQNYMIEKGIMDEKVKNWGEAKKEFYKIQYNLIMDCRRVIDYILNDKPLYLIPEQFRIFKKFVGILSEPPKTEHGNI